MQIIGFYLTKISTSKSQNFKQVSNINTDVEFLNLEKDKVDFLKELEAIRVYFKFSVNYYNEEQFRQTEKEQKGKNKKEEQTNNDGEVIFEGNILLSANQEEAKNLLESWKTKDIPDGIKVPIFNLILRKCTTKALDLEDQVNLPYHLQLPSIQVEQKEAKSTEK